MIEIKDLSDYEAENILTLKDAADRIKEFKSQNKTVGLCHGGYDLLHPGHVKHFQSAKEQCDELFVSITIDKFVTSRKGTGRPIFTDKLRAFMVANIKCVDYVILSPFKKGTEMIHLLKPNFYIKGPDFINKTTPGITEERQAIKAEGGEMRYTENQKLSTTEIIDYIKNEFDVKHILIGIDRDGTLIEERDFLGKNDDWEEDIQLKENVIAAISYLQTKYKTKKIVVTNQGGVARGLFSEERVREINNHVNKLLKDKGIIINNWQYCPDADAKFVEKRKDHINFIKEYVKEKTRRKPSTAMIEDGLKSINCKKDDFARIIIFGDRPDDENLAKNLDALYLDAKLGTEKMISLIENYCS